MGSLAFYGADNGAKSGWGKDYYRARDTEAAANDPFAIHLEDEPSLKALYADSEHVGRSAKCLLLVRKLSFGVDNYHRDMNVFAKDITIEDDMAVLVKYNNGATMTYHLTAYSVSAHSICLMPQKIVTLLMSEQPWEGYRVMFNGDKGRLELEVVESAFRLPKTKGGTTEGLVHGENALPNEGGAKITLHPLWSTPQNVPYEIASGGHGEMTTPFPGSMRSLIKGFCVGGGDERMLDQIFGARPGMKETDSAVTRLGANQIDGALAMAVGLAANESFKSGKLVKIDELLGVTL